MTVKAKVKIKNAHVGGFQLPMFTPDSKWSSPKEFIDFSGSKFLGIDTETHDPNLMTRGPGFLRKDASVVGISLADENGRKIYLPIGHENGTNLDRDKVINYVRAQVSNTTQTKVGANLTYDFEALWSLGIEFKGPVADIQIAEPLLDEDRDGGYSLEALSRTYLQVGKDESLLRRAATDYCVDPKKGMYTLPPEFVGPYAEDDAYLPILILQKQLEEIKKEKLSEVWQLESDLLPILWKMRRDGVAVDLGIAEIVSKEVIQEENTLLRDMNEMTGLKVDPWASKSLYAVFEKLDLTGELTYTKTGQASFTSEFLGKMAERHAFCAKLHEYRTTNKMRRDFIDGLILSYHVNGRLHAQWHPMRRDDEDKAGGTKTGRIASTNPNLTQVPSRSPKWGKKIRRLVIPDSGGQWCKSDYSSQEPRITLHFAFMKGFEGAAEVRRKYLDNPATDYHQTTADMIKEKSGKDIGRRAAKDINLGNTYGMGINKLADKLGISLDASKEIMRYYHLGVPFVRKLGTHCMEYVEKTGYIRTVLGRKRRFKRWESAVWEKGGGVTVATREEAEERWGSARRAQIHKALNAMVQGSAADQTKSAIIQLDREGLTPHLQVYDELGNTIHHMDDVKKIKDIMEHAIDFSIPTLVDPEIGDSWGNTKKL